MLSRASSCRLLTVFHCTLLAFSALWGCAKESHPGYIEASPVGASHTPNTALPAESSATASGSSADKPDAAAPLGSVDVPSADAGLNTSQPIQGNCGDLVCRGHGGCQEKDGVAACVCDKGYIAEGADTEFECVVDKHCKKLHSLREESCVQLINSAPAVALFFAVDYCAGTAVPPDELGDLSGAFRILEDGKDISDESFGTVVERDVESYITIAIDVSSSVTGDGKDPIKQMRLSAIVAQLREFVGALKAKDGEPPVSVNIMVFGRFVAEYVPFTTDLAQVESALDHLEKAPLEVSATVSGDIGTALFEVTKKGIQSVERIQRLRDAVSYGGVLTTGTLVIVTDGADTVGGTLDTNQLSKTIVNVISIGISSEIDDERLAAIGKDGSFLAPTEQDWTTAFDEIATRVREYPSRSYLLAYCTSHSTGKLTVSITLSGETPETDASCNFDASLFSKDPKVASSCNVDYFKKYCETNECGTFLACGACGDGECCNRGQCLAPSLPPDCKGLDELCLGSGLGCIKHEVSGQPTTYSCGPLPAVGEECLDGRCALGAVCGQQDSDGKKHCEPVIAETGDRCGSQSDFEFARCPERNCARPSSATGIYFCKTQARANDVCGGSDAKAECETGTTCKSNVCTERTVFGICSTDAECASYNCDPNAKFCLSSNTCSYSWSQIINRTL